MTWADSNGRAPATGIGTDDDRQADQLAAGAERTVAAPLTVVRQHLLAAVRNLGFQLTVEQLSVIQAVRGSKLGAVTLQPARMPVQLQIGLEAGPAACRVTVQVSDRWPAKVGRNWGATAVYQDVFGSVLAAVDAALARLDPAAAAGFAVKYFEDFVAPQRQYRAPSEQEREALAELRDRLAAWDGGLDAEALQGVVYDVGRERFDPMKGWFTALYQVLLGADQGPRFGGFIALYGVEETVALIDKALAGELA